MLLFDRLLSPEDVLGVPLHLLLNGIEPLKVFLNCCGLRHWGRRLQTRVVGVLRLVVHHWGRLRTVLDRFDPELLLEDAILRVAPVLVVGSPRFGATTSPRLATAISVAILTLSLWACSGGSIARLLVPSPVAQLAYGNLGQPVV